MTAVLTRTPYGELIEPTTLKIERRLPGTIDRVWAYLTESDLRRQWLAAGDMELKVGAPFELVWRNNELNDPPAKSPEGFPEEHRRTCTITEVDAPRKLTFTWNPTSDVTFLLEPQGSEVLLTVIHRRLPDRDTLLNVSAGWHAHLDLLVARVEELAPEPFWDEWRRLKAEYDRRLPA